MSDTLENTNKLLNDLERKLSLGSNTSHQTHQSAQSAQSADSQSSIVVNKSLLGLGKQNVQSTVLQYIRSNEHEFSTNDLFEDRQARFLTQFGKHYNATSPEDPVDGDDATLLPESTSSSTSNTAENLHGIFYDFDDYDDSHDDDTADDDDDDMLLPPSPPRSPPRDIDPDKLYGLYDFSGPDPLHCTLSRDEPVYLVNDEDNYWWLVRKLTKLERLDLKRGKKNDMILNDYDPVDDDDEYSDEEDGKIGFVPAECLETYGERLARLNCFKNEELEKSGFEPTLQEDQSEELSEVQSKPQSEDGEGLGLAHSNSSKDSLGLGINVSNIINYHLEETPAAPTLTRTPSSLKRKNYNSNKSVTFEDLSDLKLDEEESTDYDLHLPSRDVLKDDEFHKHYFDIPREAIGNHLDVNSDEKRSEVLSDVYPNETPLLVNKTKRSPQKDEVAESPLIVKKNVRSKKVASPNTSQISQDSDHGSEPVITQIIDLNASTDSVQEHVTIASHSSSNSEQLSQNSGDDQPSNSISHQTPDLKTPVFKFEARSGSFSDLNPPFISSGYQNHDAISIGSFSPDTPKTNGSMSTTKQEQSPNNSSSFIASTPPSKVDDDLNQFRRSVILDRLNKVTFDIQEQLNLSNDLDFDEEVMANSSDVNSEVSKAYKPKYFSPDNLTFGAHLKESPERNTVDDGYEVDGVDLESDGYYYGDDTNNHNLSNTSNSSPRRESVTPLTSLNLLNNGFTSLTHGSSSKEFYNPIHSIITEDPSPLFSLIEGAPKPANDPELDFGSTTSKSSKTTDLDIEADSSKPKELEQEHKEPTPESVVTNAGLDFASKSLPILDTSYDHSIDSSANLQDMSGIRLIKQRSTPTSSRERRKSKPVHDMFLPILGKFDDLADKLAQLDELL